MNVICRRWRQTDPAWRGALYEFALGSAAFKPSRSGDPPVENMARNKYAIAKRPKTPEDVSGCWWKKPNMLDVQSVERSVRPFACQFDRALDHDPAPAMAHDRRAAVNLTTGYVKGEAADEAVEFEEHRHEGRLVGRIAPFAEQTQYPPGNLVVICVCNCGEALVLLGHGPVSRFIESVTSRLDDNTRRKHTS